MIIIEKNEGPKIPYEVTGKTICFNDELMLNLAKQERDWPVHKDICYDKDGNLNTSTAGSEYYVAQIDIPAAEYEEVEVEAAEGDEPQTETRKKPLDMNKVTLTLWSIDN